MERIKFGEFFSGPGGIAKGAHLAAEDEMLKDAIVLQHEWAFDIDRDSCSTYIKNIPGADENSVLVKDVREFLQAESAATLGEIQGFAFGFPCNDFSLVGEHRGLEGKFGGLYKTGVSVLKVKQPEWFIAENVGGIRSANNGDAFQIILDELRDSGYSLVSHLYRFEEYGVPQARHRVIIVGIRDDLASSGVQFKVPAPTHGSPDLLQMYDLKAFVTASDALNRIYPEGTKHMEFPRQSEQVKKRLSYIDPGQNAFTASEKMPENLRLKVSGATISQIYKKLRPDRPAYTVTGSGGGGTHMYHWASDRALSNRERARLQTFPDDFEFCGTRESIRKQIGMAVPVEGARVIFLALFKSLLGMEYPSVEANIKS